MGVVRKSGPPRLMLLKFSTQQRIMIMDNVKSLKHTDNEDGFNIYVRRLWLRQCVKIRNKVKNLSERLGKTTERTNKTGSNHMKPTVCSL